MKKEKYVIEEPVLEEAQAENKKKKSKKPIIITLSVMAALGVISAFCLWVLPLILPDFAEDTKDNILGMYGSNQSFIHYPIDHELDVSEVDEYIELDRYIYYTDGMETVALDDNNIDNYGSDVQFFVMYFYYVIEGKYEEYNAQFTDNYYKKNEPYYSFTQQMVYDIQIEKLESKAVDGGIVYTYDVAYKIFRNNGTFRNDIGSDASKTLCFELLEKDGKVLIDSIDYYID